jgi:hypothetical protein
MIDGLNEYYTNASNVTLVKSILRINIYCHSCAYAEANPMRGNKY